VFVDDALVPFHDQWAFLAGIRQIDPAAVEAIADPAPCTFVQGDPFAGRRRASRVGAPPCAPEW
jgi:hypothetical protein